MSALIRHTTQLPATVVAPAEARAALGRAVETPIAEDVLETARLLITELVTNSVRHATLSPAETIRVEIGTNDRRLRIEVYDSGKGSPDFRPSERVDGGYGLQLVDRLADRWGADHDDQGTCVWFELVLPPSA